MPCRGSRRPGRGVSAVRSRALPRGPAGKPSGSERWSRGLRVGTAELTGMAPGRRRAGRAAPRASSARRAWLRSGLLGIAQLPGTGRQRAGTGHPAPGTGLAYREPTGHRAKRCGIRLAHTRRRAHTRCWARDGGRPHPGSGRSRPGTRRLGRGNGPLARHTGPGTTCADHAPAASARAPAGLSRADPRATGRPAPAGPDASKRRACSADPTEPSAGRAASRPHRDRTRPHRGRCCLHRGRSRPGRVRRTRPDRSRNRPRRDRSWPGRVRRTRQDQGR